LPLFLTILLLTSCPAAVRAAQPLSDATPPAANKPVAAEADKPAAAEQTPGQAKKKAVPTNYASIVQQRPGQNTLVIDYLWKVHDKTSVEVRLVPTDEAESAIVAPLYFLSEYLRGDVPKKVYHCLDAGGDHDVIESFTKDKTEFRVVGLRNSLGRPAVMVVPRDMAVKKHGKEAEFVPSLRAVFLTLDCWAVNDRMLTLDVPREGFSKPGQLHVWFMRGERVLWEEAVAWPGRK